MESVLPAQDVVGFGALISACEKAAQWQLAVLLLQRALESTMVVPNLILFNAASSACEPCHIAREFVMGLLLVVTIRVMLSRRKQVSGSAPC